MGCLVQIKPHRFNLCSQRAANPRNWKGMTNVRAAQPFMDDVCQFCDIKEDSIVTELRVVHSYYALPTSHAQAMLTVCALKKMMGTQWHQLKQIKTQLRKRYRRILELLLFIERYIPIKHNEVINIYKFITNRIQFLFHLSCASSSMFLPQMCCKISVNGGPLEGWNLPVD